MTSERDDPLQAAQGNRKDHAFSTIGEIIAEGSQGIWCVKWGCTTCNSHQIRYALERCLAECGSLDAVIEEVAAQSAFPGTDTHVWILRWLGSQTDRLEKRISGSPAGELFTRMLLAKRRLDDRWAELDRRNRPEFIEAERARKRADRAERHRVRLESKPAIDQRYRASLDQELIEAYLATDYHVFGDPPLVIKIGQTSAHLAQFLAIQGVSNAAYITAWNPKGRACDHETNAALQARLIETVEADGFEWIAGEGCGSTGDWPPERSILVLGVSRAEAKRLGHKFRQNAIVWLNCVGAAELIMLMPMSKIAEA